METIRHWSFLQKIGIVVFILLPAVLGVVFWSGIGGAQSPTCAFEYSSWSDCDSSGNQYRTVASATPADCTGTPEIKKSCTYTPATCTFNYGAWGNCDSSGYQYRPVTSATPSGCTGTPDNRRSCTAPSTTSPASIACAFTYADWGSCNSSGMQYRAVNSATPAGCTGTPETYRSCTFASTPTTTTTTPSSVTCAFTYADWGSCNSSGMQYRAVNSATPAGCTGTPETYRSCTFASTPTITTTAPSSVTCAFNYSTWGNCDSSGYQYRAVTSATPSGCTGTPETRRSCSYSSGSATCLFAYSSWGSCNSVGRQYRSVTSATPAGCTGTPETYRSCTYSAPSSNSATLDCTSSCSSWGVCDASGFRSRSCTAPSGCPQTNWTEKNSCAYQTSTTLASTNVLATATAQTLVCAYQCSAWSNCLSGGYQERMCQGPSGLSCMASQEKRSCTFVQTTSSSSAPAALAQCSYQCSTWSICSPAGIKYQNCWPSAAGCPGETKTNTQSCVPTVCKFTYSDWGNCAEGWQFRNILTSGPINCVGGEPILKQACAVPVVQEEAVAEETEALPGEEENPAVVAVVDPEISVNDEWKKETFSTTTCQNETCGGNADPDNDGLSNNDEFRFGTDPLKRDTDNDGKVDGKEVADGTDPLKSSAKGEEDAMVFENPKESGKVKETIYQVTDVEMVDASEDGKPKQMKISGRGPASSYVTVYVYSGQPVIVTVKTDSNGDWTYTVDKELEDGDHQVFVAVTNNSGAIKAKSAALPFVKTAQAITVAKASGSSPVQSSTKAGISLRALLFIFALSFFGVVLAVILIGMVIKKIANKRKR